MRISDWSSDVCSSDLPDVVRVRHQMEDVQRQLDQERDHAAAGPSPTGNEYSRLNPLYQELRSQLSQAQRDIAATRSRMAAAESMLADEMARSRGLVTPEDPRFGKEFVCTMTILWSPYQSK